MKDPCYMCGPHCAGVEDCMCPLKEAYENSKIGGKMKQFFYGWGYIMNTRIPLPRIRISPVTLFTLGKLCATCATVYILWTALRLIIKAAAML